jgi:hypothetical protein
MEAAMSSMLKRVGVTGTVVLALAASSCGTTPGERAVSGGLLGAGAGAAIGSVTGSVGKGALIGGLGGAAVGALTSPSQLNLGSNRHCVRYSSYSGRCVRWGYG